MKPLALNEQRIKKMKNLIKQILKENDFEWAGGEIPKVYRVVYNDHDTGEQWVEGYFTMESFRRYLQKENEERYDDTDEYETEDEFDFEEVKINW
jgi:hypothetical protein